MKTMMTFDFQIIMSVILVLFWKGWILSNLITNFCEPDHGFSGFLCSFLYMLTIVAQVLNKWNVSYLQNVSPKGNNFMMKADTPKLKNANKLSLL